MPSTLQRSRDLLSRGVARVRSGLDRYERGLDEPGPEIKVEPFDAHNVTTSAALIKLGTSIAAERRARANLKAEQAGAALETEKTRAEIARLRAQEQASLRGPAPARPTAGQQVITQGRYKGWTVTDANADRGDRGLNQSASNAAAREARVGRVAAARARLAEVDKAVERDTDDTVNRRMASYEAILTAASNGKANLTDEALIAFGIDPAEWKRIPEEASVERAVLLQMARRGLLKRTTARTRAEAQRKWAAERDRHIATIQQGEEGFGESGGATDDPLSIEDEDPIGVEGL